MGPACLSSSSFHCHCLKLALACVPCCCAGGFTALSSSPTPSVQDLSKRQILPILLTGAPLDSEQREREHQRHAPDDQQQRYKQERQGGRHSLDTNLGRWQGQRRQVQLQRPRWSRQPSGRDSARAFNRWASSAGGSEAGEEVFQTAQSMPAIISMARGQPSFTRSSSWLRESAGQRAADQAAAKSGAAAAAGHAGNESGSSKSGKSTAAAAGEVQLEPADYQRVLAERGVDCRGWKLVVTGHSLGAAVAALVGMQLRDWYPGGSTGEWVAGWVGEDDVSQCACCCTASAGGGTVSAVPACLRRPSARLAASTTRCEHALHQPPSLPPDAMLVRCLCVCGQACTCMHSVHPEA